MSLTVEKLMQRHDRGLILGLAIGIVVLVVVTIVFKPFILSVLNGPELVTPEELANVYHSNDTDKLYIRMENVQVFPALYDRGSHYGAIYTGRHWILVRGSDPFSEKQYISFTGVMNGITSYNEEAVYRQVLSRFNGQLSYVQIDTASRDYIIWYILTAACGIGAALLIWRIIDQIIIAINPKRHSIMRHIARYGDADFLSQKINLELTRGTGKIKHIVFAKNWMVYSGWFRTAIFNRGDIIWIYVRAEHHEVRVKHIRIYNYTIHKVCIHEKYGQVINIDCGRNYYQATEIASQVARYSPWSLQGYDNQLETVWKNQRSKFIAAVDERRTRIMRTARGM